MKISARPAITLAGAGLLLVAASFNAFAQSAAGVPAQPVRYLAANCANCHGTNGAGSVGLPGLAGLKKEYIIEQMNAFKNGKREATLMHQIAKGYTDEQIAAMAAFFEQQKKN
jgi:sulfide dehydrogenase cytochrome subunit